MSIDTDKPTKLVRRLVTTYRYDEEREDKKYHANFLHNKIVDPSYEFAQIGDRDLSELLGETLPFKKQLMALFDKVMLWEVRSQIVRYAALYRLGGWYFDADVYLSRSLDELRHHKNIVLIHEETKLASKIVLKFEKRHPLPLNMLKAITENDQNDLHLFDVEWFSGKRLLSAVSTRAYPQEIAFLKYDDYVNYPGSVFETSEHNRRTDWRILQHFGVRKGQEPSFESMPKRISMEEAELIAAHVEHYDLVEVLGTLKSKRPVYFSEHQILNNMLDTKKEKKVTLDPRKEAMRKAGYQS